MARGRPLHSGGSDYVGCPGRVETPLFRRQAGTEADVTRVTDRPSFKKARADQLAHFAVVDEKRTMKGS